MPATASKAASAKGSARPGSVFPRLHPTQVGGNPSDAAGVDIGADIAALKTLEHACQAAGAAPKSSRSR